MSTTINIAGSPVVIIAKDTIVISDKETGTSTATFTVRDDPGTANYSQQMTVTITDSVRGLQFSGYIDSAQPELLNPGPNKKWLIICKDKTWLASKRQVIQPDFPGTLAGDVITDLHSKYLAAEGVTANYALDHDSNAVTFGAGTLVSTTAANGDLELASAGTTFTKTETTTADFATGTLTNVIASNNALSLTTVPTIKYTGTCASNVSANPYCYTVIWRGSITINANDQFVYDLFVNSNSPQIQCAMEMICSDGTIIGNGSMADQFGNSAFAGTDLTNYADDQWCHRIIQLTNQNFNFAGKTLVEVLFAFEGNTSGIYTAYAQNITLQSSGHSIRQTFFGNTLFAAQRGGSHGYYNISLKVVQASKAASGSRVSPAYSMASAGIAKQSLISWQFLPFTPIPGTKTYAAPLLIESSYDGGTTWQACTSGEPLPNLPTGLNTGSLSVTLRETLSIAGPDPTITPVLTNITVSVSPSYAASKSDAVHSDKTSGDFSTGNLNNVIYNAGLAINGAYRSWSTSDLSGFTLFFTGGSGSAISVFAGQLELRADPSGTSLLVARLDFAGSWQDFVVEFDFVHLGPSIACSGGFEYRTTGWQNVDNTYAYHVSFERTAVTLYRGSNTGSGAGSTTTLQTSGLPWVAGAMYHVQVAISGSSHMVYVNGLLYINVTDGTWSSSGQMAFRNFNGTGTSRQSIFFDNFGVMNSTFLASRVHPSLNLDALNSVENSVIQWNSMEPSNTLILIEASIDGGSTYQTCTNNAVIPQLPPGVNVAGKSLLIRETLTTQNANATPVLLGITSAVVGNYVATGTRVSPALVIGSVGRVGSTSITWTATTPPGTSLVVEESLISATGAWTATANGGTIPTITAQPMSVSDGFSVSTSGNYTGANYAAGANATWTFDTANSRLTGLNGTNGLYVWNQITAKDLQVDANLNQAANAGLIWRYTDTSNFYFAIISDASSGTNPNTIKLYKRAGGVTSGVLATGSITFTRGTYHTFRVVMSTTSITVYFDGASVASITDSGLAGPGSIGFLQSSLTQTNWYSIRGQQFGDDVTGKSVWTRLTLSSTDPTLTPAVTDLVTSVRGQQLMSGSVIGVQNYQYQGSVMQAMNDVAKKCVGYTVGITDASALTFQTHTATPADWPLATVNSTLINGQQIGDIQWSTPPTLKRYSPLYRNRSIVVGGTDVTALIPDTRMGDSFTQSWALAYPVALPPVITLNGQIVSIGVQGVDTGKQFYYQIGSKTISQDPALTPLDGTDTLTIPYYGQISVVKQADNVAQQTIVAALEGGTSGIVEVVETVAGLNAVAAQALATSRVAQYAILSQDWTFTTLRSGLKSGQLLQVFCPEYPGMADTLALITQVDQVILQGSTDATNLVFFNVTCTTGANVGDWTMLYQ